MAELKDMRATVVDNLEIAVSCNSQQPIEIEAVGMVMRDGRVPLGSLMGNATRRRLSRKGASGCVEEPLRFSVKQLGVANKDVHNGMSDRAHARP